MTGSWGLTFLSFQGLDPHEGTLRPPTTYLLMPSEPLFSLLNNNNLEAIVKIHLRGQPAQWVQALVAMSDNQSSTSGTHMIRGEIQLPEVVP